MGLLQAGIGALTNVLADTWREYFYCEGMTEDVLVIKGAKRTGGLLSNNNKGNDNIISNGSIIAVNEGQCMMIVDQGAIVEFSAQAGEFVWDSSTEPSIFYGSLSESIKAIRKSEEGESLLFERMDVKYDLTHCPVEENCSFNRAYLYKGKAKPNNKRTAPTTIELVPKKIFLPRNIFVVLNIINLSPP